MNTDVQASVAAADAAADPSQFRTDIDAAIATLAADLVTAAATVDAAIAAALVSQRAAIATATNLAATGAGGPYDTKAGGNVMSQAGEAMRVRQQLRALVTASNSPFIAFLIGRP